MESIGTGTDTGRSGTDTGTGVSDVKDQASELAHKARAKAMQGMDARKGEVSEMLDRVAGTMEESTVGSFAAGYVRRGREFLDSRSSDQLVRELGSELRHRPALVIGAAFVGGFALVRLLKG